MKAAVIYSAKSTPDEKGSTADQTARVRARLEELGDREIVGEFSEENVSAYHGSRGPELERALAAAFAAADEHGEAELWVFHSSRLARGSGKKAEGRSLLRVYVDALERDVTLRSVENDGVFQHGAMVAIQGESDHQYSEAISVNVRRGKQAAAEGGKWPGGPTPDGLLAEPYIEGKDLHHRLIEDPERAPLIRRIFEDFDAGHSTNVIARTLNREGHRTQRAQEWQQRRIRNTLRNPIYAGRVVYRRTAGGEETSDATNVEAIIPAELFDRVQTRLSKEAKERGGRRPSEEHGTLALHRLAVCNRCDAPMQAVTSPYARKDGTRKRKYRCKGKRYDACDAPQVDALRVDAAVVEHIRHLFIDVEAWQADLARGAAEAHGTLETAVSDARAALAKAEREVQRLGERYKTLDGPRAAAVLDLLVSAREEKLSREGTVAQAEDALVRAPTTPPTDEVLDLHSRLANIVRGGDAVDLNDRLRLVFDRFEIDTLPDGKVLVLPYLREDLVDRFADPGGYLRVISSRGISHAVSDAPPSAGPLIVLETAPPNASA
jgi:site-specific DNA recombinase